MADGISPAPSFEAAPVVAPPPAEAAPVVEATPAVAAVNPEVSKAAAIDQSVGKFVGEKFSKPTDKPKDTIQQLSDYDLAADRAPIVKHLKLNGFSDDDIGAHLSKMKMGEGGTSNVVLEQQKGRTIQAEAAGITSQNRAVIESSTATQGAKLKNEQADMSDAVRTQQNEGRSFKDQVEDASEQVKREQNVMDTTPYDQMIDQADDAQLAKYAELKGQGYQEYLAKKAQEKIDAKTPVKKEPRPKTKREPKKDVAAETGTPPSPEQTQKRAERIQEYTEKAKADLPPRPTRNGMPASEFMDLQVKWNAKQIEALKQIESNANLAADMDQWDDDHPQPATNDPTYKDWLEDQSKFLSAQEQTYPSLKDTSSAENTSDKTTEESPSAEKAIAMLQNDESARALAQELARAMQQQKDAKTDAEKQAAAQAQKAAEDKDPKKSKLILALLALIGFVGVTAIKNSAAHG